MKRPGNDQGSCKEKRKKVTKSIKNIATHPFIWGAPLVSRRKTERYQQQECVLATLIKWRAKLQQQEAEKGPHLSMDTFTFMLWFSSGNLTRSLERRKYQKNIYIEAGKYQNLILEYQISENMYVDTYKKHQTLTNRNVATLSDALTWSSQKTGRLS